MPQVDGFVSEKPARPDAPPPVRLSPEMEQRMAALVQGGQKPWGQPRDHRPVHHGQER